MSPARTPLRFRTGLDCGIVSRRLMTRVFAPCQRCDRARVPRKLAHAGCCKGCLSSACRRACSRCWMMSMHVRPSRRRSRRDVAVAEQNIPTASGRVAGEERGRRELLCASLRVERLCRSARGQRAEEATARSAGSECRDGSGRCCSFASSAAVHRARARRPVRGEAISAMDPAG
jgi:hypothetical protein